MGCCSNVKVAGTAGEADKKNVQGDEQDVEEPTNQRDIKIAEEEDDKLIVVEEVAEHSKAVTPREKPETFKEYNNIEFSRPSDYPEHYCQVIPSTSRWICEDLSEKLKEVLDILVDAATRLQENVALDANLEITIPEIKQLTKVLYQAYPELFFFRTINYTYSGEIVNSVQLLEPLPISKDEVAEMELQLLEKASEIISFANNNEMDLCTAFYECLRKDFVYSYTPAHSDGYFDYIHNAISSLIHREGVCQGVAYGWLVVGFIAGIKSMYVSGTATNKDGPGPHGWNVVELDEEPYVCDFTWCLTEETYTYLCCPDEIIAKTHVKNDETTAPECLLWDRFYYQKKGCFVMLADQNYEQLDKDLVTQLRQQFEEHDFASQIKTTTFIFGMEAEEYKEERLPEVVIQFNQQINMLYYPTNYVYEKNLLTIEFSKQNSIPFKQEYISCTNESSKSLCVLTAQLMVEQFTIENKPEKMMVYFLLDGTSVEEFSNDLDQYLVQFGKIEDVYYKRNAWSSIGNVFKVEIERKSLTPFRYVYLDTADVPPNLIGNFLETAIRAEIDCHEQSEQLSIFFELEGIQAQEVKPAFLEALYNTCDSMRILYTLSQTACASDYVRYDVVKEAVTFYSGELISEVVYYLTDETIDDAKSKCVGRYTTWKLGERHFKLQLE